MKADAVFEGGGVKGIAFIGALQVMEDHGYTWEKVAGTSAGSIVAALLSAGYSSRELKPIFEEMDYLCFLQRKGLGRLPVVGPVFELMVHEGIFRGDRLELFIEDLLQRKGVRTFGDLPREKLRIVASDVTSGKMLVLPDDLPRYDVVPESFPIARAVRMSSSIPFFFQPAILQSESKPHYIVDGALLSNYPVWLFDVPGVPKWPTIGFRLHDNKVASEETSITGLFSFTRGLLVTMLDAHDRLHVEKSNAVRTIFINTLGVRATQFQMSLELRQQLFTSGEDSARCFLNTWNFEDYVKVFRTTSPKYLV
ncbi:patatin-like phospholipase family protein [Brevibacillus choshinensis]|uniref:patatin-like phospholipase family protein n=1 Tax=Brevibacillus choshinensis TaxID=54911 RepID=UPI002E23CB9A|nr:patatin-like phospholipase family protein [Brevibacillus choshinensis]MED4783354.1 patatin-like phospholipase family protein [Brevibacillus choshinensis]